MAHIKLPESRKKMIKPSELRITHLLVSRPRNFLDMENGKLHITPVKTGKIYEELVYDVE